MPVMEGDAEVDMEKTFLKIQQMTAAPVGSAHLVDNLYGASPTRDGNAIATLLLCTHKDAGKQLIDGSGVVALVGGILEVHDRAICVLIVVLGERIYPVFFNPLDEDTMRAFKQIVRQESLFLGAIFDADQLPFRLCPLPSGGMFKMFANPPKNLKRWTAEQFARGSRGSEASVRR